VLDPDVIAPSALLAYINPERPLDKAKEELRNTMEGGIKQMLEEGVKKSKEAGVGKVTTMIRSGKPVNEIISASEEGNFDLIVMASSKITSPVRSLGSVSRRVLESARKPVLIVHE
jgi:nucleotide-binding universal stress UspA family protein